jgi:hypothetical protein
MFYSSFLILIEVVIGAGATFTFRQIDLLTWFCFSLYFDVKSDMVENGLLVTSVMKHHFAGGIPKSYQVVIMIADPII